MAPSGAHGPFSQPIGQRVGGGLDDMREGDPAESERRLRALNILRQKALVSDTKKLLQLANELNAEIGGADSESLTADQLRKLAAIEKLAHSVKEKMSTSVGRIREAPASLPPFMR
jgi:hypothetical protein